MQKLWQKKLKLNYKNNVIDIVQFGSSVLEESNPKDMDIAVIFKEVSIKIQLEERQEIKRQIEKLTEFPVHIESFDINSLFLESNFARQGILFYGKSIITGENFAERFGIIPNLQISYVLKDLKKKEKVRFNYLLNGRGGNYGLLRKYGGKIIYPGVLETLPKNELIFTKAMKEITNNIKLKRIFAFSK
jgi:predicted nucleotidyltransferase